MIDESRRLLEMANTRLRVGKLGVSLELRGKDNWIYLRGTFPPKSGSNRTRPYQQRIALQMRGTPSAIKQAEAIAKVVGGELNLGRFDWGKWSDAAAPDTPKPMEQWIKEFEEHYWKGRDRTNASKRNTWNRAYLGPLKRLPKSQLLTLEVMIGWVVENSEPDSRRRGHYCTCARELGRFAKITGLEVFKELSGNYSTKPINPRELPSDAEIVEAIANIIDPGWRFLAALQATYGLRNHECFGVDYSEFPIIRVSAGTKTGTRPVGPVHPDWARGEADTARVAWALHQPIYPKKMTLDEGLSNDQLGLKITGYFNRSMPWGAYNLRHCYARRCAEIGLAPDVAAQLMGHSLLVHLRTYRAWIGEKVYLDRYRQAISASQLPLLNGSKVNPQLSPSADVVPALNPLTRAD